MKRIYAKYVFDGVGNLLKDITLTIEEDRISKVEKGKNNAEFECEYLTPAFIDAHSHIGLDRHGEGFMEDDTNEKEDSIITFADALDGIQMDDKNFQLSVESGVLYSCVLHGSGNIIGSKAVVIKNFENNTKKAFIKYAGYKAAVGYNPKSTEDWKGTRFSTRIGVMAHLRKKLLKAEQEIKLLKSNKKSVEELDIDDLFFINLLKGKEYLRVHLHKEDDFYAMLRIKERFGINFVVEHSSDFHSYEAYEDMKRNNINLIYGPLDSFAYKPELKNEDWRNIKFLLASKVNFGLMSDHPVIMQSTLFLTLRWFLRFGLEEKDVISYITSKNANILGLEDLGSIKPNKKASLLLWNGDPFSLKSKITTIFAEGKEKEVDY